MSDLENSSDALNRLEELLTDNELGADHAYDLVLNSPDDQKSLQWIIERLRSDIHETYRVFNAWFDLQRREKASEKTPVATRGSH